MQRETKLRFRDDWERKVWLRVLTEYINATTSHGLSPLEWADAAVGYYRERNGFTGADTPGGEPE